MEEIIRPSRPRVSVTLHASYDPTLTSLVTMRRYFNGYLTRQKGDDLVCGVDLNTNGFFTPTPTNTAETTPPINPKKLRRVCCILCSHYPSHHLVTLPKIHLVVLNHSITGLHNFSNGIRQTITPPLSKGRRLLLPLIISNLPKPRNVPSLYHRVIAIPKKYLCRLESFRWYRILSHHSHLTHNTHHRQSKIPNYISEIRCGEGGWASTPTFTRATLLPSASLLAAGPRYAYALAALLPHTLAALSLYAPEPGKRL